MLNQTNSFPAEEIAPLICAAAVDAMSYNEDAPRARIKLTAMGQIPLASLEAAKRLRVSLVVPIGGLNETSVEFRVLEIGQTGRWPAQYSLLLAPIETKDRRNLIGFQTLEDGAGQFRVLFQHNRPDEPLPAEASWHYANDIYTIRLRDPENPESEQVLENVAWRQRPELKLSEVIAHLPKEHGESKGMTDDDFDAAFAPSVKEPPTLEDLANAEAAIKLPERRELVRATGQRWYEKVLRTVDVPLPTEDDSEQPPPNRLDYLVFH